MGKAARIAQMQPIAGFLFYFKNLKFRWKLFWSYIIAVIIPVMVLGFYSYYLSSNTLEAETRAWMGEAINQTAENLNAKFTRYSSLMEYIVFNAQILRIINDMDSDYYTKYNDYTQAIDPLFVTTMSLNNEIDSLLIYTNNPTISERANTFARLDRISSADWYSHIQNSGQAYWQIENDKINGYMKFYKRFRQYPDSILAVQLDYQGVFDLDLSTDSEFGVVMLDQDRQVIYSHTNLYESQDDDLTSSLIADIQSHSDIAASFRSGDFLVTSQILENTGWTLFYYSNFHQSSQGAGSILGATFIIIASCLILLLLLTWVFSNTLVRRIHNLNNKMQLVESGNFELDISSTTKDEIGDLTNKFGKMLRQVKILIHEVYESRISQKEAEMKALQAQINPHFLYNTLSLINWKAIAAGAPEISQLTRSISTFYRTVLNNGQMVIPIRDEIANTRCYLDIQLIMHDHSFDVVYEIDDAIFDFEMIKIILQPIVENAIEHGLDKMTERRGRLLIAGFLQDEAIVLKVTDNGRGMAADAADRILQLESSGYGLKNVDERLKMFFGEQYGLSVVSAPDQGTEVVIRIPQYRRSKHQDT